LASRHQAFLDYKQVKAPGNPTKSPFGNTELRCELTSQGAWLPESESPKTKSTASSTGRAGASGEEAKMGGSGSAVTKASWCMRIAAPEVQLALNCGWK